MVGLGDDHHVIYIQHIQHTTYTRRRMTLGHPRGPLRDVRASPRFSGATIAISEFLNSHTT